MKKTFLIAFFIYLGLKILFFVATEFHFVKNIYDDQFKIYKVFNYNIVTSDHIGPVVRDVNFLITEKNVNTILSVPSRNFLGAEDEFYEANILGKFASCVSQDKVIIADIDFDGNIEIFGINSIWADKNCKDDFVIEIEKNGGVLTDRSTFVKIVLLLLRLVSLI